MGRSRVDNPTRNADRMTEPARDSYLAIADRAADILERNRRFLGWHKRESLSQATAGKGTVVVRRNAVGNVNRSAGRTIEATRRAYHDIADDAAALRERNGRFLR